MDVPVEISQKLANKRVELKNGGKKDIHEQDKDHLKNAYNAAKYVANQYGWKTINCVDENKRLKSIDEIQDLILSEVKKLFVKDEVELKKDKQK